MARVVQHDIGPKSSTSSLLCTIHNSFMDTLLMVTYSTLSLLEQNVNHQVRKKSYATEDGWVFQRRWATWFSAILRYGSGGIDEMDDEREIDLFNATGSTSTLLAPEARLGTARCTTVFPHQWTASSSRICRGQIVISNLVSIFSLSQLPGGA